MGGRVPAINHTICIVPDVKEEEVAEEEKKEEGIRYPQGEQGAVFALL
jgi:hypothetical protein